MGEQGGPGSRQRQPETSALWIPRVLPSCSLVLPAPGVTSLSLVPVPQLSTGLYCVGSHCLPPLPQHNPAHSSPAGPRTVSLLLWLP